MGLGYAFTCRFNFEGLLEGKRDHVRVTTVKRAKGTWWLEGMTVNGNGGEGSGKREARGGVGKSEECEWLLESRHDANGCWEEILVGTMRVAAGRWARWRGPQSQRCA
jgi:hypothetical protein